MRLRIATAVLVSLVSWGAAAPAFGVAACTATDIRTSEGAANCPSDVSQTCTINKSYEVTMTGCIFDFGSQHLNILGGGARRIDAGSYQGVRIRAGSITMQNLSEIRGKGNGASPNGASITIETTGNFTMLGSSKIDVAVSGDNVAGDIFIDVGGNATIEGTLSADATSGFGIAGEIIVRAEGNISTSKTISATNPQASFSPGTVEIVAFGSLTIGAPVDVSGGDGGEVSIESGLDLVTASGATLDADGTGDAGFGGSIDVFSLRGITLGGQLQARGNGGTGQSGGSGGTILVEAQYGTLNVNNSAFADGAVPDGDADEVSFIAEGTITVAQGATISARTDAGFGAGGVLGLESEVDVVINGTLDCSGGLEGGELLVSAGRNVTLSGLINGKGRNAGAFGGSIFVDAGLRTRGTLLVEDEVDSGGGICSFEEGCGAGGLQNLTGCNVTLANGTSLQNRGADGGDIFLSARGVLTIASSAVLNATTNIGTTEGSDGSISYEYPQSVAPVISGLASVAPTADSAANPLLTPCTTCGNGVIEAPETCDDGNTVGCDGCSFACEIENCNDGNRCTADSCVSLLGCLNEAEPAGTACCNGAVPRNCNSLTDQCNVGVCNLTTDACETQPKADGTACSDDLACTTGDTCNDGVCGLGTDNECICIGDPPDANDPNGSPCWGLVAVCMSQQTLCSVGLVEDTSACVGVSLPSAQCCGNGNVDPSEDCDAGMANADTPDATCRTDCTLARCGDGIVDPGLGEACDDANADEGDGCNSQCAIVPTFTPTPTVTGTATPTSTPSSTPTSTPTLTPTPTPTPPPGIAGQIRYYGGGQTPVAGVDVELVGPTPDSQSTAADGAYDFAGIAAGNWRIAASKAGGDNGAITALDAAYALQSLQGNRTLDSSQTLACDVDGDGVVGQADIQLILERRVGLLGDLPVATSCGTDWFFQSPAGGPEPITPDPNQIPCEAGGLTYTGLSQRRTGQDLLAILIGDCTGNWQP